MNFEAGKVVRWIDYWDGRHFGLANLAALKLPDSQFPADFKESTVGETAPRSLQTLLRGLAGALREKDYARAVSYFAPDALLIDHPSHVEASGAAAIGKFLARAGTLLPYVGPGTTVRHVVGSSAGGAYEWTASGAVPRGLSTVELDPSGRVSRFDAMWDGARLDDDALLALAGSAIER